MSELKHKFQQVDDYFCGPVCLEMIYSGAGIKRTSKDIIDSIKNNIEEIHGVFTPGLAIDLQRNNVKNKMYMSNSYILEEEANSGSIKDKIQLISEWIEFNSEHKFKQFAQHLLKYIELDGSVEIKSFSIKDLKEMIDAGSKIILTVNAPHLWGKKKIDKLAEYDSIKGNPEEGHFIILDSYNDSKFRIYDPYPTNITSREGIYEIDENIVFNSCLLASGIIIEVLEYS